MDRAPQQTPAAELVRIGFASLIKPPFRSFWLVGLLIAVASPSLVAEADDLSLAATVLFALMTFLIEMATVLAAAEPEPDPSGDVWIRKAFRKRAYWRFVVAAFVTDLAVAVGLLFLIVGGVILAGIVGLAPQAAALERRLPFQALARSAGLTNGARSRVAIVYAVLVIIPTLPSVALLITGTELAAAGQALVSAAGTTFALAAWIALTKAFIELGGTTEPAKPAEPAQTKIQ